MGLIDWLIVIIPVTFVIGMGLYSRRYIRGVADFLATGRVCVCYKSRFKIYILLSKSVLATVTGALEHMVAPRKLVLERVLSSAQNSNG